MHRLIALASINVTSETDLFNDYSLNGKLCNLYIYIYIAKPIIVTDFSTRGRFKETEQDQRGQIVGFSLESVNKMLHLLFIHSRNELFFSFSFFFLENKTKGLSDVWNKILKQKEKTKKKKKNWNKKKESEDRMYFLK